MCAGLEVMETLSKETCLNMFFLTASKKTSFALLKTCPACPATPACPPPQAVAVDNEEGGDVVVSTAPEDLRYEVYAKRAVAAPVSNSNLLSTAGLNLPSRALVSGWHE